jgi:hypothetical protein
LKKGQFLAVHHDEIAGLGVQAFKARVKFHFTTAEAANFHAFLLPQDSRPVLKTALTIIAAVGWAGALTGAGGLIVPQLIYLKPRICCIHNHFCPNEVLAGPLGQRKNSQSMLLSQPNFLVAGRIAQI